MGVKIAPNIHFFPWQRCFSIRLRQKILEVAKMLDSKSTFTEVKSGHFNEEPPMYSISRKLLLCLYHNYTVIKRKFSSFRILLHDV